MLDADLYDSAASYIDPAARISISGGHQISRGEINNHASTRKDPQHVV